MNRARRQIQALRDTAWQLSLRGGDVWHAESGVRGGLVGRNGHASPAPDPETRREQFDFDRPATEEAFRSTMRQLLCGRHPKTNVIDEPWRTFGFSFAAAAAGASASVQQEADLDGIGHSFVYGQPASIGELARLVAFPAVKYLSAMSSLGWRRSNSYGDPKAALGDWVYMVYEIGLKAVDPNLRRYYRFVTAMPATRATASDMLVGLDGQTLMLKRPSARTRSWGTCWQAAGRRELAFARLGIDLVLASRIALDHLLDMDVPQVTKDIFTKWQSRIAARLNDTQKELLRAAAAHTSVDDPLTGPDLVAKAGYDQINTNMKTTLSGLVKMNLLDNPGRGYFLPAESRWVLNAI